MDWDTVGKVVDSMDAAALREEYGRVRSEWNVYIAKANEELTALREENARLRGQLADAAVAEHLLTRELDEARAALAGEREHHHHAHGPNCREAEAEVARLEGLILKVWEQSESDDDALRQLGPEARRIRGEK